MAQMTIKCPHCKTDLQVQKEWIGLEVECTVCKRRFTIPDPIQAQAVLSPVPPVNRASTGTFHFVCPSCNGEAELPESLCGTEYECQFCFDKHIAYSAISSQKNIQQPVIEKKFIFICPECNTVTELSESLKDKEYECSCCCETSIAREAVERVCPYCGEKIKIKATVCKHCKQKITPITSAVKKENKNVLQKSTLPVNRNVSDFFQKIAPKTMPAKYHSDNLDYKDVDCVKSKKSTASLVLGIINCLTWIIPIAGIPIGIIGLVLGFKKQYKTGIILNVITLTAAVTNSVIGAILGANGRLF